MKRWKIFIAVLLAISCMAIALPVVAASQLTETPEQVEQALSDYEGTHALSWQNFFNNSTYVAGKNGSYDSYTLSQLLPHGFNAGEHMGKA